MQYHTHRLRNWKDLDCYILQNGTTNFLHCFSKYDWQLTKSPAGAHQYEPVNISDEDKPVMLTINVKRNPMMTDADMAIKELTQVLEQLLKDSYIILMNLADVLQELGF